MSTRMYILNLVPVYTQQSRYLTVAAVFSTNSKMCVCHKVVNYRTGTHDGGGNAGGCARKQCIMAGSKHLPTISDVPGL